MVDEALTMYMQLMVTAATGAPAHQLMDPSLTPSTRPSWATLKVAGCRPVPAGVFLLSHHPSIFTP